MSTAKGKASATKSAVNEQTRLEDLCYQLAVVDESEVVSQIAVVEGELATLRTLLSLVRARVRAEEKVLEVEAAKGGEPGTLAPAAG